ncbi:MAG TPA: Rpn family recombination-promoting nuclease/putative transposase [Planctomycetota bacterium]|nr:Rpn family recombination-promoting nuclease/putative transposase [Planctomycetota bacterium]
MDEQPIRNPHDALFRGVFADPRRAAELLRSVLPSDVIAAVDWSSLQRIDTSFVDEDLRDHQADLLFRARINGRTGCLYVLFEHKAGQARFTVFQLLRYVVRVWEQCRADEPSATHLPLVLPFVVHHGDSPWAAPRTLHELLDLDGVPEALRALQPSFSFLLDDLGATDEADLRRRRLRVQSLLPLLHLQQLQRHGDAPMLLMTWRPDYLRLLAVLGGRPIHNMLCSYVAAVRNDDLENVHAAYKRISKTSEEQFMTIAERLKQEGRLEGRQEGRQEGQREGRVATLLTLMEQRFGQLPAAVVERVENATSAELERWTLRLLTSATLSEMFV